MASITMLMALFSTLAPDAPWPDLDDDPDPGPEPDPEPDEESDG